MKGQKYASDITEPFLGAFRELSTITEEPEANGSTIVTVSSLCKRCKGDELAIEIDRLCDCLSRGTGPMTGLQQFGYFAATYSIVTIIGILFVFLFLGSHYY